MSNTTNWASSWWPPVEEAPMAMSITEFLLARIAEDEASACPFPGAAYLRALRECAAKRAIIKQHEEWPVLVERQPEYSISNDVSNVAFRATQQIAWLTEREYVKKFGEEPPTAPMIRTLAAVYFDHPDYDPAWSMS